MLSNYVDYSFLSVYAHTEAYSPMKVPKGKDSTEIHTSHNGDKQYDVGQTFHCFNARDHPAVVNRTSL